MKEFTTKREYDGAVKYAEDVGVLVWQDDENRRFFVNAIEQLQAYLKRDADKKKQRG
jgi:transcription initiation factor TFIIH subunit 4